MSVDDLVLNDQAVDQLRSGIMRGDASLHLVPGLLSSVLAGGMWRKRAIKTGQVVEFDCFTDFVSASPLEGLGTDVRTLKNLCRDTPRALDLIDAAVKESERQGKRANLIDNINKVPIPDGTSRAAALRRLRKDRPDLHVQVIGGDLTPHKAMIIAGFRPRAIQVYPDSMDRTARALASHFDVALLIEALLPLAPHFDVALLIEALLPIAPAPTKRKKATR